MILRGGVATKSESQQNQQYQQNKQDQQNQQTHQNNQNRQNQQKVRKSEVLPTSLMSFFLKDFSNYSDLIPSSCYLQSCDRNYV